MPDGITLKRIIDMDETEQLSSSDYVLVDSQTGGNRKYALGEKLPQMDEDLEQAKEDLETKADKDGSYDDLTSGNAKQLVSTVFTDDSTPYLFRTTGGSADVGDREYVDAIVGATVAWNQLNNNAGSSGAVNGITYTKNSDGSWNISGTASAESSFNFGSVISLGANHVYLALGCPDGGSSSTYYFGMGGLVMDIGNGGMFKNTPNYASGGPNMRIKSGVTVNFTNLRFMLFDLTQMFGSTIADYIYSLEQATAGAGVAWFKKLFPNMDAEYSYLEDPSDETSWVTKKLRDYEAGFLFSVSGLQSHDTVGFNQWDEEWELGVYDASGNKANNNSYIRSKNYVPVSPNTSYYYKAPTATGRVCYYDEEKTFISRSDSFGNNVFITPYNCRFITFFTNVETYNHDICINLSWDGEKDGTYEPYEKHSYPLDSDVVLRGKFKLDSSNNLYADGDIYPPDGAVNRRYGITDLGTLAWSMTNAGYFYTISINNLIKKGSAVGGYTHIICALYVAQNVASLNSLLDKSMSVDSGGNIQIHDSAYSDNSAFRTAMSGVYLAYELATPTTETAEPYQNIQVCDDFGTEEFISTSPVPVGHNTRYAPNLRAKLEMSPDSPDGDGVYVVQQSNGENAYIPLGSAPTIQNILDRLTALENA